MHIVCDQVAFKFCREHALRGGKSLAGNVSLNAGPGSRLDAPHLYGYLAVRARREDALLADEFGDAWGAWARDVPAWLPRLGQGIRRGGKSNDP